MNSLQSNQQPNIFQVSEGVDIAMMKLQSIVHNVQVGVVQLTSLSESPLAIVGLDPYEVWQPVLLSLQKERDAVYWHAGYVSFMLMLTAVGCEVHYPLWKKPTNAVKNVTESIRETFEWKLFEPGASFRAEPLPMEYVYAIPGWGPNDKQMT